MESPTGVSLIAFYVVRQENISFYQIPMKNKAAIRTE